MKWFTLMVNIQPEADRCWWHCGAPNWVRRAMACSQAGGTDVEDCHLADVWWLVKPWFNATGWLNHDHEPLHWQIPCTIYRIIGAMVGSVMVNHGLNGSMIPVIHRGCQLVAGGVRVKNSTKCWAPLGTLTWWMSSQASWLYAIINNNYYY